MLKRLLTSWDLIAAVLCTVAAGSLFSGSIPESIARDIYGVGITVLSIVFSVFFAAVALVMTASDDDFVLFLEEEGYYSVLLWCFQVLVGASVRWVVDVDNPLRLDCLQIGREHWRTSSHFVARIHLFVLLWTVCRRQRDVGFSGVLSSSDEIHRRKEPSGEKTIAMVGLRFRSDLNHSANLLVLERPSCLTRSYVPHTLRQLPSFSEQLRGHRSQRSQPALQH